MSSTQVVSPSVYRQARLDLLAKEKEATRAQDALCEMRQRLPMVEVTEDYSFIRSTADGGKETVTLTDLFEGRRQLIVYHFMFDPAWDAGCTMCSALVDSVAPRQHVNNRSTTLMLVSRAPVEKLDAFKKRMGWDLPWVSSESSDFNYAFQATQDESVRPVEYNFMSKAELEAKKQQGFTKGEQPGQSCFIRGGHGLGEEGKVYHTYSSYSRGGQPLLNQFAFLDMTLLGRQDGKYDMKLKDEY